MMRGIRKGLALLALLCLLVGGAGMAWTAASGRAITGGGETAVDVTKTVEAASIERVVVKADVERVALEKSADSAVHVRLFGSAPQIGGVDAPSIQLKTSGDKAEFVVQTGQGFHMGINAAQLLALLRGEGLKGLGTQLQLEVALPDRTFHSVELSTNTGSIRVGAGAATELRVSSDTGSIHIEQAKADRLVVKDETGGVTVNQVAGAIEAETSTGGISIETDRMTADMTLHSDTGGITVGIGSAASLGVDLRSDVGGTAADVPGLRYETNEKHRVVGSLGSGNPVVKASTSTGGIHVSVR